MASTHPNGSLRPQDTISYYINIALLAFLCERLFRATLNSSPASSPAEPRVLEISAKFAKVEFSKYSKSKYDKFSAIKLLALGNPRQP